MRPLADHWQPERIIRYAASTKHFGYVRPLAAVLDRDATRWMWVDILLMRTGCL